MPYNSSLGNTILRLAKSNVFSKMQKIPPTNNLLLKALRLSLGN